jgi:hypothetical protein
MLNGRINHLSTKEAQIWKSDNMGHQFKVRKILQPLFFAINLGD